MIRIAVLGAGRIGRIHGRNAAAHAGARLVAVADPHAPSAEDLARGDRRGGRAARRRGRALPMWMRS